METRVPHRPTVTDPATLGGTLLCSCVLRATWLPVRNGPACRYLRITSRSCPCTLMPLWSHPRSHPCPRVYAMRMPLLAITIEWSCDRDDHHAPCTTTPRPPPSHTFLTLFFSGMVCQGSPPASALGPATRATRAHRAPPPPPPTSAAQGSTASQGPQHAFSAPQVPAFGWFLPPPPPNPPLALLGRPFRPKTWSRGIADSEAALLCLLCAGTYGSTVAMQLATCTGQCQAGRYGDVGGQTTVLCVGVCSAG